MFILFYILPCVVPLIIGVFLLRHASSAFVRLLALLTLKPIVATPLWLLTLFLFPTNGSQIPAPVALLPVLYVPVWLSWETLLPLPVIGLGLTGVILWFGRNALRTMSPLVLAILLVLDTIRWGSTYLTNLIRADSIDMFTLPATTMPTLFAVVAWMFWFVRSRTRTAPRQSVDARNV